MPGGISVTRKICCLLVAALFFQPSLARGDLSIEDLRLPVSFHEAPSPYATVESIKEEPDAPGFLVFLVASPDNRYTVHGLAKFRQCVHEIDVLQKIKEEESVEGGMVAGAADSLKDTGRGLKNLVFHPFNSVKGLGKGVQKIGTKVGDSFRDKEEGEKAPASEGFLGSTKRELAKQLGLDVYSRNEDVQDALDKMAKARMGGKGVVMVASFFLPVGLIASAVLTASGINNAADELVNDNDRSDLYKLNAKALAALGFPKEKVTLFLNHPYYTPRELTYLRFYLEKLQQAKGFQAILDAAIQAQTEVPADKILHEAQIAADSVVEAGPAEELVLIPEGILLEKKDKVVLVTAYDYLDATPLSENIARKVLSFQAVSGKKGAEVWNGGVLTPRVGGAYLLKGIKARRMCLFEAGTVEEKPVV